MQPTQNFRFGGGAAHTMINPVVALAILFACLMMFVLPRRRVIIPFLAAGFLIPMDQVLVVGPFHFYSLRILLLVGWVRILGAKLSSGEEIFSGGMNGIDKALIFCTAFTALDGILLYRVTGEVINQLGTIYTIFGIYFLVRFLIRDEEDLERTIRVFAYVAAVIAVSMFYEQLRGVNIYSYFDPGHGAVALANRDGRLRSLGPFGHPILAGTFGAILFPLFVGLWWKSGRSRFAALTGIMASLVIVYTSASSTPLLGLVAGIGALCLWPIRKQMRSIRWGIVATLIGLQMVMKAPVWALIARVDVVGGSSGYHRYMLVDQFIRHFGSWWLLGTNFNGQWGWDMWDLANQYVAVGEVSGLLPFIFFMAIIVFGFKYAGIARKAAEGDKRQQLFAWAIGASLFANIVAFFGISYYDQTQVAWYALLAMISAIVAIPLAERRAELRSHATVEFPGALAAYPAKLATEPAKRSRLPDYTKEFKSSWL